MNIRRIMLAAPVSGSGKTLLTCGILELFRRHGEHPCAFKCGPDYIDPMFHRVVCGFAGANLDSFFLPSEKVRNLFTETCRRENAGSAVLEGVMGYYDGVSGTTEQASSYDISRITKTPVILVVNARGTSLSAAALVRGFQEFRPDSRIAGVLLNRCRKEVAAMIGSVIEENCHIPVVGYVPMEKEFEIKDRHLGLYLPHEMADIHDRIKKLADRMEETVDWEKLSAIADSAEELPETDSSEGRTSPEMNGTAQEEIRFRVALAKDEAFCFYYQENMRLLESMGAEIVPFSPMHDKELPEDIDGLIIGGGYPENYGPILSENRTMLSSVWSALEGKMPLLAECGGFEYL
ncbi:MAG: cobyrinate a,c-diamide synthase, partial [Clostridium sp.]|nr:cobyrinate a,c-diamide synthase [Clostridium sp.]